MSERSAVVWNECEGGLKYFVAEGNWQKFQGVYINSCDDNEELQQELNDKVYEEDGDYEIKFCSLDEFANAIRHGAFVVECGFLP